MTEKGIYKLKIDEGFKRLISPLSSVELRQLEQSIIQDGCLEPLHVWNKTIIDGHNRYEICMRRQIPFAIQYLFFRNREEVIAWICTNQLDRDDIADEMRKYLIGKRYELEKILGAHNAAGANLRVKKEFKANILTELPFGITAGRTRERICEDYRISLPTILKYEKYSQALDKLWGIVPELVPKVLYGVLRLSHESIVELSRLSSQDARRLRQLLFDGADETDIRKIIMERQNPEGNNPLKIPAGSIKDMPAYDPDAEISGLVFTIPSWISSIDRVRSAANLNSVSDNARSKLEIELLKLKETIDSMLTAVKEVM